MKQNRNNQELIKLAESIEALAEAIEKDAAEERQQVKTAADRRAAIDYGTVGDGYNANGTDPITQFALS